MLLKSSSHATVRACLPLQDDVGGAGEALEKLREVLELPLLHPERFVTLGIDPPKVRFTLLKRMRVASLHMFLWAPYLLHSAC